MPIPQLRRCLTPVHFGILTLIAALLAGLWVAIFYRLEQDRAAQVAEVQAANANLAIALEAHTSRTLGGLDQLLTVFAHEFEAEGIEANVTPVLAKAMDPAIVAVAYVTDAQGKIILATGPFAGSDMSDRDFFLAHRNGGAEGMLVGKTITGRLTGQAVFPLSRRLSTPAGDFAGVIVLGVNPAYFTGIYSKMRIGRAGYAQIVGLDGEVRARRVGSTVTFGMDLNDGTLMRRARAASAGDLLTLGRHDGVARLTSYRVLPDYPLVVAVGQSEREALSPFAQQRRDYSIAAVSVSVLVLVLGAVLLLAGWREAAAGARIARSEALHRLTFDQAAVGITYNGLDGSYIDANRAYCQMMGFAREELLRLKFPDLLHASELERLQMQRDRLGRDARLSAQVRHIRKDGSDLWASIEVAQVRDQAGRPEFTVAVVQDITERKRAREALQEQLDELRRFQRVAVHRELRMREVEEENRRLREGIPA